MLLDARLGRFWEHKIHQWWSWFNTKMAFIFLFPESWKIAKKVFRKEWEKTYLYLFRLDLQMYIWSFTWAQSNNEQNGSFYFPSPVFSRLELLIKTWEVIIRKHDDRSMGLQIWRRQRLFKSYAVLSNRRLISSIFYITCSIYIISISSNHSKKNVETAQLKIA